MNRRGLLRRLVGAPVAAMLGISALKETGCAIKPKVPVRGKRLVGMDMGRVEFEADKVNIEVKSWKIDNPRGCIQEGQGGNLDLLPFQATHETSVGNFRIDIHVEPVYPYDWEGYYAFHRMDGKTTWDGYFYTTKLSGTVVDELIGKCFELEPWLVYARDSGYRFNGNVLATRVVPVAGMDKTRVDFKGIGDLITTVA